MAEWDDSILDSAETRRVPGLAIAARLNAPMEETRYGVFRMSGDYAELRKERMVVSQMR